MLYDVFELRTSLANKHKSLLAVHSLLCNLDDKFTCNSEYDISQCVPYVLSVLYTWNLNFIVKFPIRTQSLHYLLFQHIHEICKEIFILMCKSC